MSEEMYVRLTCVTCSKTCVQEETDITGPRYCKTCHSIIDEQDATEKEYKTEKQTSMLWYN